MSAAAGQQPPSQPFSYTGIYRTEDDAFYAISEAQNALGFPCSKKRSKLDVKTGIRNRIDVRCHRSGSYRRWKHSTGQYQTSSRKTNCPYLVIIRFDKQTGGFLFEVMSEEHNHEPVENPNETSTARKRSQMQFGIERLERLVEARSKIPGIKAKAIAEHIASEHPGVAITNHDVHLILGKIRRSRTGAFATIQDFLDGLQDNERVFYYAVDRGPDEQLTKIFWIYRHNIEDWRRSSEVLMLDNTYKINRLKMPLLQITGTTPLHTNFSAGFGLTVKEDVAAFTWILKQLKIAATKGRVPLPMVVISDFDDVALKKAAADIFDTSDQQVCMWHILKNVTLNIRKMWNGYSGASEIMSIWEANPASSSTAGTVPFSRHGEDLAGTPLELEIDAVAERAIRLSWQALQTPSPLNQPPGGQRRTFPDAPEGIRDAFVAVCRADSESDFWQRWAQLCYEFPAQKAIITYLHDTYVAERVQFAHFSVKWFQNYGIRMISCTKSSHLKDFFDSTSTDLCQLERHIWEMVTAYRESYELCLQHELGRQQAHFDESSIVKDIALRVGSKTLDEILQQVRLALDELQGKVSPQSCTGQFTKQMGLPCRHQILSLMKKYESLELSHIDRHWWLKDFDEEEPPIEQQEPAINVVQPARPVKRVPVPIATTEAVALREARAATARNDGTSVSRRDGQRKNERVPVPRLRIAEERSEGPRRNLKRPRAESQSDQQQEQAVEETRDQQGAREPTVQEQPQPSEPLPIHSAVSQNQQIPHNQQEVRATPNTRQRSANPTTPARTRAPTRTDVAVTRSQTQVRQQLTQPSASSLQPQIPLPAPVASSSLVQGSPAQANNYQQLGGLAALDMYNMGGIPQQPPQAAFGSQGPPLNFFAWQPPEK